MLSEATEAINALPVIKGLPPGVKVSAAGDAELQQDLFECFAKAMRDPDIIARVAQLGYLPIAGGPADYAANIQSEIRKWAEVIRTANIKAD